MLKHLLSIVFLSTCLVGYAQTNDSLSIAIPDSVYQKPLHELDSIQQSTKKEFGKLKSEYDSIEQQLSGPISKLQHKTDSLNSLNLPTDKYTKELDSLKQLKDTKLAAVKGKVDKLKEGSISKINELKLPPEISKEAQQYTQGLNKLDVTLPNTDINFPEMPSLAKMNLSLPGVNIPSLQNISLPEINASLPQVGMDQIKTPEEVGDIKALSGQLGSIGEVSNEIKEVKDKLKDPEAREELIAEAEEKATELAPVKDVAKELEMPEDVPFADGQLSKDELQEQAKKQAIDHFAGKEQQVQAAMSEMSKLKQKHSSVQSLKDIPKKVPNPMKGKPFVERLVPAIGFQVLLNSDWLVDFNPNVGYRFTGRIRAGLGWNQRWGFTKSGFNSEARIYGPRVYGECLAFKGFSGRLELETMYTRIPPILKQQPNHDPSHREWVPGVFVGLKKDYTIYKRLKGTIFVLYNVYNPDYKSPYGDRLMTRFGLEYSPKKKKKGS